LRAWIEAGGDVGHREDDGSTALHGAFLFGRSETALILIDSGADPKALNNRNESCIDMLNAPWGITAWVAGLVKVNVDEDEVLAGRAEISEQLEFPPAPEMARQESESNWLFFALFKFPVTGHLWFLWFLCWLIGGFSVCIALGRAMRIPRPASWLSASLFRYAWVIPLTMIPQAFMEGEGVGFGPDTSIGLLPMPVVLAYYAVFFGFGAMYFDSTAGEPDAEPSGVRSWIAVLVSLGVLFPIGLAFGSSHDGFGRLVSVFVQASFAWLMTFGLMGLFGQVLSRESKAMRYLSDSSYWLYLAHIPVIIFVQYLVCDFPVSAFIKFPVVCAVTSVVLLISYQLFVRYTPIGTLLNGERTRGGPVAPVKDSGPLEPPAGVQSPSPFEGNPA